MTLQKIKKKLEYFQNSMRQEMSKLRELLAADAQRGVFQSVLARTTVALQLIFSKEVVAVRTTSPRAVAKPKSVHNFSNPSRLHVV